MGSKRDQTWRDALLQDVLAIDQPPPELLVRYAREPESLDAEERREVEEALARFPGTADQLRVLQNFDPRILEDEPERKATSQEVPGRGLLRALSRFLGAVVAPQPARFWIPATVAVGLLLAFLFVGLLGDAGEVARLQQQLRVAEAELQEERDAAAKLRQEANEQRSELASAEAELQEERNAAAKLRQEANEQRSELASLREGARAQRLELASLRAQLERRDDSLAELRSEEGVTHETPSPEMQIAYVAPPDAVAILGGSRFTSGLRSAGGALPNIVALVPAHVGHTVSPAPSVYWFLSDRTSRPLSVTVVDPDQEGTVLDVTLPGPHEPGIQGLDLASQGMRLAPGQTYQWFVSVVAGETPGPDDAVASGLIRLVEARDDLEADLRRAGTSRAADVYAKHGLWYDALASLSKRIDTSSRDSRLRARRAALLKQVGLDLPALYDRGR